MHISTAKPEDASVLSALAREAKRSWGYPDRWMAAWEQILAVSPEYLAAHPGFVAVEEEECVGFAVVEIAGPKASLAHLRVMPDRKRSGIGRALFHSCEGAVRQAGADTLEIESDPHAEEFYPRVGAVRVGEVPADMEGVTRSLPLLRKRLR